MTASLNIFGVTAATGLKLVACLYLPGSLVTLAGTTISGGTVTGTTTVPTAANKIYVGLTENPTQIYEALATLGGTNLPDTIDQPYTVAVRAVDSATDMTSYTAIATAYTNATAAGAVKAPRQVPDTFSGGYLRSNKWGVADTTLAASNTNYATIIAGFGNQLAVHPDQGTYGRAMLDAAGTATLARVNLYGSTTGEVTIDLPVIDLGSSFDSSDYLNALLNLEITGITAGNGITHTWQLRQSANGSTGWANVGSPIAAETIGLQQTSAPITQRFVMVQLTVVGSGAPVTYRLWLGGVGQIPPKLTEIALINRASPLQVTVGDDTPATMGGVERTLVVFQQTQLIHSWQVKNSDGSQYNLTGHSFELVVHNLNASGVVFSITDAGQFDLLASDANNPSILDIVQVTILASSITDSLLSKYEYKLRDLTAELVIGTGTFLVKLAPLV